MSGTAVIWSLVAHNAPVLAVVPIAGIKEGDLPLNITLPAIAIMRVSGTPRNTLAMTEAGRLRWERVQVSALFKGVAATPSGTGKRGVDALLKLIIAACPNQSGTINGISVDSIVPDIQGPDLADVAAGLYSGSQDFIVRWHES